MQKLNKWLYDRLSHIFLIIAWLWGYYTFFKRNRVEIVGRENLPGGTNIIYISNHLTWIDSFLIVVAVTKFWEVVFSPKRLPWNAADRQNFLTHKIWKHLFALLKIIPVDRGVKKLEEIHRQIELFKEVLQDSNLLLFFEGTRSRTGEIGPCHSGVAEAIRLAHPRYLVPIFIDAGVGSIMPIDDYAPDKGATLKAICSNKTGQLVIGEPINLTGRDMSRRMRAAIARRIRQSVVNLGTHC